MKLISWNVNGLRAVLKKGFAEFLAREAPDVLCLQETRAHPEQVDATFDGYAQHWNPAERKGYAGTATFTRVTPDAVRVGLDGSGEDAEGRVQTLAFPGFHLVNVYTPNARRDLARLDYRTREWDPAFLAHLKALEADRPVVFCGDLNVAHTEIDLANPKSNRKNAGFTPEERAGFDNLVAAGFIDTFREFTREGGHYTWWSNMGRARERNIGWRIDYFGISPALRPRLRASYILPAVEGSDHCPIVMELDER